MLEIVDLALRDANPHEEVRACGGPHRVQGLQKQPRSGVHRAAVAVGAQVNPLAEELIEQIAVGAVHLAAVEAGRLCPSRRMAKTRHRLVDLRLRHGERRPVGPRAAVEGHLRPLGGQGGRSNAVRSMRIAL